MTDLLADLESMARQSDDAALACEAQAAAHRPEYERCLPATPAAATPEAHARALELYAHVVVPEREARRLRAEAKTLRRAVAIIVIQRSALAPFAELAVRYDPNDQEDRDGTGKRHSDGHRISVSLGEARAARTALENTPEGDPPILHDLQELVE